MIKVADEMIQEPKLDGGARCCLRAVVLRILPSQDGRGAAEAGCPDYVLRAVETRLKPASVGRIKRTLALAESLAQQLCGASFAEITENEQDRVLRRLQLTPHPTIRRFFHRLVALTLEGFLCDPRHGGNRGGVGWRYLGIRNPRLSGNALEEESCTTS